MPALAQFDMLTPQRYKPPQHSPWPSDTQMPDLDLAVLELGEGLEGRADERAREEHDALALALKACRTRCCTAHRAAARAAEDRRGREMTGCSWEAGQTPKNTLPG